MADDKSTKKKFEVGKSVTGNMLRVFDTPEADNPEEVKAAIGDQTLFAIVGDLSEIGDNGRPTKKMKLLAPATQGNPTPDEYVTAFVPTVVYNNYKTGALKENVLYVAEYLGLQKGEKKGVRPYHNFRFFEYTGKDFKI